MDMKQDALRFQNFYSCPFLVQEVSVKLNLEICYSSYPELMLRVSLMSIKYAR